MNIEDILSYSSSDGQIPDIQHEVSFPEAESSITDKFNSWVKFEREVGKNKQSSRFDYDNKSWSLLSDSKNQSITRFDAQQISHLTDLKKMLRDDPKL